MLSRTVTALTGAVARSAAGHQAGPAGWTASRVMAGRALSTQGGMRKRRWFSGGVVAGLDPVQEALLAEPCILVDNSDKVIGQASKMDCHRMQAGSSLLHRAFSLFIFNQQGKLLLQKRSDTKITFPSMWTNTCCSHPLYTPQEREEEGARGVRLAAQRRVEIELGVMPEECSVEDIKYLTRILYAAPSSGEWGEHELDYILMLRGSPSLRPNPDEVSGVEWVARDELAHFITEVEAGGGQLTPWFKLISKNLLPEWWKNLDQIEKFQDHSTIHNYTG